MRNAQPWGTFAVGEATAAGATAFATLARPYPFGSGGEGGSPILYKLNESGTPNWMGQGGAFTNLNTLIYTTAGTAHSVAVMQPLNFTTFAAAVAKNSTSISLTEDPGTYATVYRFPTYNDVDPAIANNTIAAGDYVAYQLDDGSWRLDTIASGTQAGGNLVLTTGTANVDGATIAAGNILFFYGISTDVHPVTGAAHWITTTIASTNRQSLLQEGVFGGIRSLFRGLPLLIYSNNDTAQGRMNHASGYYSQH